MRVRSLGGEDPLEEGLAPQSRIRARRTPCTEEPGGLQSVGSQRVRQDGAAEGNKCTASPFSLSLTHIKIKTEDMDLL